MLRAYNPQKSNRKPVCSHRLFKGNSYANIQCCFLCFLKSFNLCQTWAVREEDKSRITSAGVKFMRREAKYTGQDYKANDNILSELKISPVIKKIQSYINKWI